MDWIKRMQTTTTNLCNCSFIIFFETQKEQFAMQKSLSSKQLVSFLIECQGLTLAEAEGFACTTFLCFRKFSDTFLFQSALNVILYSLFDFRSTSEKMGDIGAALQSAELIPSVLPEAPKEKLNVVFDGIPVEPGKEFAVRNLKNAPRVTLKVDPDSTFSLIMIGRSENY